MTSVSHREYHTLRRIAKHAWSQAAYNGPVTSKTLIEKTWALALLTGLACCSSIKARTHYDAQFEFSAFQTFTMAKAPETDTATDPAAELGSLPGYSEIEARRIENQIVAALESKGLRAAEESEADLIVRFTVGGKPRTDLRSVPMMWSSNNFYDIMNTWAIQYVQAMMSVDVLERATQRVVWHGWASAKVYDGSSGGKKAEQGVRKIMKRYPPKK